MVVTVTSLRLRHWWGYFRMTWLALHIVRQTRLQPGFIRMKNTGFGMLHFTLSAWDSEQAAKDFARSGAHAEAMKASRDLALEIRTYTYPADSLPRWRDAKRALLEKGRAVKFA